MGSDPRSGRDAEALRLQQLQRALALADGDGDDQFPAAGSQGRGSLAALRLALRELGSELELPEDQGELRDLLERHSIPHRIVTLPSDLRRPTWSTLLAWRADDGVPVVLLRRQRRPWVWHSDGGGLRPLQAGDHFLTEAVELFRPLPAAGVGGGDLLRFALRGDSLLLWLVLASALLISLINLGLPGLSAFLVGVILPQSDRFLILESAWLVVLLVLLASLVQWQLAAMRVRLETAVALRLEGGIWSHLLHLPFPFFQKLGSADLSDRAAAIRRIRDLFGRGALATLLGLVFSGASLLLMFVFFPALAPLTVLYSLLSAVAIAAIVRPGIALERPLQQASAECQGFALQAVQGLEAIRVAGDEPHLLQQWLLRVRRISRLQSIGEEYGRWVELLARLIVPVGTLLVFFSLMVGGPVTSEGQDPSATQVEGLVASFVAFQAAFLTFNGQLTTAAVQLGLTTARLVVLWERAQLVFATPAEGGGGSAQVEPILEGRFELRGVSVGYEGSATILHNIDLTIPGGSHLAITGPSGSGKTTLLRVLMGLMEPTSGDLLVDGQPLSVLSRQQLRRQFGVVLQDAPLPTGSVASIVSGGRPLETASIWEALEIACLAEEVRAMADGLDTAIGEGGATISGGQRQRLCLARALARRPKVLLLDEATSALDAPTQQRITESLEALAMTRIVIAHRLSTVRRADRIVVLERGRIREAGDYASLMALPDGYLRSRVQATGRSLMR